MKLNLILFFPFMCAGLISLHAQNIYVVKKSGSQAIYSLSNIKRITFSTSDINILKTDNISGIFAVKDLRALTFSNILTSTEGIKQTNTNNDLLQLFPNPANEYLNVQLGDFEEKSTTLSIITLDGRVVYLKRTVKSEELRNISIAHLPKGSYLCQISNRTFCKVAKFIKQ